MKQTCYAKNYVQMQKQNFDNPPTLAPTNKNDSTVALTVK